MANPFYSHGAVPATGAPGASAPIRAEFDNVVAAFDKLPALTGNANKAVVVKSDETGLTVTTGALALSGSLTMSGAFATTLTVTGTTAITLPTSGTLLSTASVITVAQGGTGLTTLTAHALYVGNGASAPNAVAVGATNTVLHGNTGADPTFSAVDLTADVTGTLPVSKGGTSLATLTAHALYVGNGTSAPSAVSVGATGTVLRGQTAADPVFGAVVLTTDVTGVLPVANGGTSLATLTAHAVYVGNGTSAPSAVTVGATGTVLRGQTGTDPVFGAVVLTTDVTGTLPVANGGTSLATLTIHALYVGNGTSAPTALAVGTTNTVLHGNTGADPSFSAVVEADITLANNTTNNVSTARHGFAPIAPNDASKFLDGTGAYSIPSIIPQNSQSVNYTTVLGDAGKHIYHPTTDDNPRTFTIDSNANVAYPIGTVLTFVNDKNVLTIAITSDTMVLAGGVLTGSRTLVATGIATALKVTATRWVINGTGLA